MVKEAAQSTPAASYRHNLARCHPITYDKMIPAAQIRAMIGHSVGGDDEPGRSGIGKNPKVEMFIGHAMDQL